MYQIPYEAEFECPKGHTFKAEASPLRGDAEVMCPRCYSDWIAANVPKGKQISNAVVVEPKISLLQPFSSPKGNSP